MKHQIFTVLLLAFWLVSIQCIAQTQITIKLTNEADRLFILSETGKIYFEDNNLFVSEDGITSSQISIPEIKKITFNKDASSITDNNASQDNKILIYPNPAADYIYVANIESEAQILLFSIEGKLLIKSPIKASEALNISNIPAGIYLIKVNNQTVKLIKQ